MKGKKRKNTTSATYLAEDIYFLRIIKNLIILSHIYFKFGIKRLNLFHKK